MTGVERMLKIRGVLEPTKGQTSLFDNRKEDLEHAIIVGSHYLADTVNYDEVDTLNKFLEESEKIPELVLEPRTVNYKECLLESFKAI